MNKNFLDICSLNSVEELLIVICLLCFLSGCHTGHVTFYVAEHFQPREIVGLDIDQQLIEQARHQLWNRIQMANTNPNNETNTMNANKRYPYNLRFQQV